MPIMVVMMWSGHSQNLLGTLTMSVRHRLFGLAATGPVAIAVAVKLLTCL